jgi:beta-glucosidase
LATTSPLAAQAPTPSIETRVNRLLARMTLAEKLGQLSMFTPDDPRKSEERAANGALGAVLDMKGAEHIDALQRMAVERSRLGIPILFANDVIHGYRTIFPIPLGLASGWDPESGEMAARIAAQEARAAGTMWTFAPMVDIARDPRWGRIAEGAGEDPYLGSVMAAAYVRGFQGSLGPESVLACAKHYVAYGAAEAGRDYNSTDMSEAILREVYLPPFKAAADAGAFTFMSAFNSLNGIPASANRHTLREILRHEWKFRGFVVSDWTAISELIPHGLAGSLSEASSKALKAGVDMDMMAGGYEKLAADIRKGGVPQSLVDDAVRRVLLVKFRLGLFERPYTGRHGGTASPTAESRRAARTIASRSLVLLKNEGALPLSKHAAAIAVIGPLANSREDLLGSWYCDGKAADVVTLLDGIRAVVSADTKIEYAVGSEIAGESEDGFAAAVDAAKRSDVVVLAVGEAGDMTGESASRTSLDLPGHQPRLVDAIVATGKPVALIVFSGRPLTIAGQVAGAKAVLWAPFPGTEGGHAIADVLFGDVNPSGRLPVSFPRSAGQIPIYYSHLRTGRPTWKSEKYTSSYIDSPNSPLYPFGFGLSYTDFEYSALAVTGFGFPIKVSATIRNSGSRRGYETVQLYVNDPVASVARPVRELKGFRRVTLDPGQSARVEFTLERDMLRFWLNDRWQFEPGVFNVWIAPDSESGLKGTFAIEK